MTWLDIFVLYLYGLKWLAIGVMVVLFIFGLDALFIDCYYWIRNLYRKLTIYRKFDYSDPETQVNANAESPADLASIWFHAGGYVS